MNFDDVKTITRFGFPDATDEQIQAALDAIDTDALHAAEAPRWTHEVWDRTSPINGTHPADVLAKRNDIPETGDVVLVKQDGGIVFFQPHDATQPGFVPIADGAAVGAAMAAQSVTDSVDSQTLALVAEALTV
tara:strand:- start:115 stop:513 length:399 start_codon:yes stop_codon:yes gene_type:complete